ncbi:MAG TPA: right-handed parallel beta-helix repeat-containing protein [Armatimonadota bacterium]
MALRRTRPFVRSAFAVAPLVLAVGAARADVYYVSASSPAASPDGLSWPTAYRTIRDGLLEAVKGDEVWVMVGTYKERFTLKIGVGVYGGFAGTETQRDQRVPSNLASVVDGNGSGTVVTIPAAAGPDTILDGMTIWNGNHGIVCSGSSATISHNTIKGNNGEAGGNGGGIYCDGGSPILMGNTFAGNTAAQACAIYDCWGGIGGGAYLVNSSPTCIGNAFIANKAAGGGAIGLDNSSGLVSQNTITGNSCNAGSNGGGIYAAGSSVSIVENTISDNAAPRACGIYDCWGGCGGAICTVGGSPQVERNAFLNNSANYGGAIYCVEGDLSISRNTFTKNTVVSQGGAVFAEKGARGVLASNAIVENGGGAVVLRDAWTVDGNDVNLNSGGGILIIDGAVQMRNNLIRANPAPGITVDKATATMINCTIALNSGGPGVAATNGARANLVNTIIAFNKAGVLQGTGSTMTLRATCVAGNTDYDYSGLPDQTGIDGNILANPRFVNRVAGDFRLSPNSPCIDAGDDSLVPCGCRDFDLRLRIIGAHVDMGAFEAGSIGARTAADVADALRILGGLAAAAPDSLSRLNVERGGSSASAIDWPDVLWMARAIAGLEPAS